MTKFEDLVSAVGDFGPYQKRLIVIVLIVIIPASINTYMPMFILTVPDHRCALDNYPNDTYAVQSDFHASLINATIPLEDGKMKKCDILRPSESRDDVTPEDLMSGRVNMTEESCSRWVFDKQYFDMSIIDKLDLVCDRLSWRTYANMAMMVGKLVAALAQGVCSDRFGRRNTLLLFIVILIANNFVNPFIFNIPSLLAFRFFAGLVTTSCYMNCFVIALEFVSPRLRQPLNVISSLTWIFGGIILDGVAYGIRNNQHLMLACAGPSVLFLSYYFIVPESPRWLISKGRIKEARETMEKVARVNDKKFPEELFAEMVAELEEEEAQSAKKQEGFFHIFKNRTLAVRFSINCFNWCANSLTYYGTLFNVQNLSGSIYLNFVLANLVDCVGMVSSYFLVDRFGRKKIYDMFLLIATLSCLTSIFPAVFASESDRNLGMTILSLCGRSAISTSFNIMFLYCAEMFPTSMRNSAMGASSMFSRIGSIAAPLVADAGLKVGGSMKLALPLLVFGCAGFLAFVLALFLPETTGKDLPDTIEQALELGKKKKPPKDEKPAFSPEFVKQEEGTQNTKL